jgi:hypothetical protein
VQSAAKEYEVRQYESAVWGSTHLEGLSRKQAAGTGFMRLFRYIQVRWANAHPESCIAFLPSTLGDDSCG